MSVPPEIDMFLKRPQMYVHPVAFDAVCSYLMGYDQATKGGLLVGFHEWLVPRVGRGDNISWPALVELLAFPAAEDPRAESHAADPKMMIEYLVGLLREFFDEQEFLRGLHGIYVRYDRWLRAQSWYEPGHPRWVAPGE